MTLTVHNWFNSFFARLTHVFPSEHFLLICGEGFELLKVTNEMEDTAVSRQSIA